MKSINEIITDQDFNDLFGECIGNTEESYFDDGHWAYVDEHGFGDPVNDMSQCWMLVEKVGIPVGKWNGTDGYFYLVYAEFAEHIFSECSINEDGWHDDENKIDLAPWSAHLHIGFIGDNIHVNVPEHWKLDDTFCSRGATPQKAIILACALALGKVNE